MIIHTVEYAGTIAKPDQPVPGDLPQIAFSGRSNVGKSSLINMILRRNRAKIAHVSATPGKTQALNFYRVNDLFFLVDLPGYGYARVPQGMRDAWEKLIDWYLKESAALRGVVHLVDARHKPAEHDLQMVGYLAQLGHPAMIVLTKMDKLKQHERTKAIARAVAALEIDEEQIVPFSSKTGEGRDALLEALDELLASDPLARPATPVEPAEAADPRNEQEQDA